MSKISPTEHPRRAEQARLVRYSDLADSYGITYSRQHLRLLENTGKFPRRVRLGDRLVGWWDNELVHWLNTRSRA